MDNTGGVLHDASRTAEHARAALKDESGMLSLCTHLYHDWYYCAFNWVPAAVRALVGPNGVGEASLVQNCV